MMTKFVCYPDADNPTVGYDLDLSQDTDIAITFSVQDLADITKRRGAFSKTIALPSSKANDIAFRYAYNVQSFVGGFTPNKQVKCALWNDGVQVFRGTMQMLSMSVTRGVATYEVGIYGEEVSLFKAMEGVKLVDTVGVTGMNHTFTESLVTGSWDDTFSDASGFVYGAVDGIGLGHVLDSQSATGPFASIFNAILYAFDRLIPIELFRPNIWVKKMVDLIFAQHGYRYESTFFQSTEFERLVIPYAGEPFAYASGDNTCFVATDEDYTEEGAWQYDIVYNLTSSPYINTGDGQVDTNTGIYTSASGYAGLYYVSIFLDIEGTSDTAQFTISFVDVATSQAVIDFTGRTFLAYYNIGNRRDSRGSNFRNIPVFMPANTQYKVLLTANQGGMTMYSSRLQIVLAQRFSLQNVYIDMRTALPADTLQIDLLSDLQKMFNLYFYQSPLDPTLIYIEPFVDFYSDTEVVDWSQKSDEAQEMQITTGDTELRKQFTFAYRNGGEALAKSYQDTWKEGYGSRIYNTDNFYGKGEQRIETKCATVIPAQYRTDIVLGRTFDVQDDGTIKQMKTGYRIAQYNYVEMTPAPSGSTEIWYWVANFGTNISGWVSGNTLPYIGHVDNPYDPQQDLAFGMPKQIYWALPDGQGGYTPYTNNNLFNGYWKTYIEEIASKEAMTVQATFLLTVTDIARLDFRIPVYWHGVKWRLLEISDYRVGQNVMCRVKLRRILNLAEFSPQTVTPNLNYNLESEVDGEVTPTFTSPVKVR
jgi:hypothetical protein